MAVSRLRDSGWKVWDGLRVWVWDGGFRMWKMQIWGSGARFGVQGQDLGCRRNVRGKF